MGAEAATGSTIPGLRLFSTFSAALLLWFSQALPAEDVAVVSACHRTLSGFGYHVKSTKVEMMLDQVVPLRPSLGLQSLARPSVHEALSLPLMVRSSLR